MFENSIVPGTSGTLKCHHANTASFGSLQQATAHLKQSNQDAERYCDKIERRELANVLNMFIELHGCLCDQHSPLKQGLRLDILQEDKGGKE